MISKGILTHRHVAYQRPRGGSKKFVQQGRSHFCAQSLPPVREHGKMTRTPLAAFFNSPPEIFVSYGLTPAVWPKEKTLSSAGGPCLS